MINGLHTIYPKVPEISIDFDLRGVFTEGFWPYYKWYMMTGTVYFSMVGIAFLMATQVSLSLWLFLVVYTTIAAIMLYHGVDPYDEIHTQAKGATLAMGGLLLFLARSHLWRAFRAAFVTDRAHDDHSYASYRWLVWGLMICVAAAVIWQWCTGLPLSLAIAQVVMAYLSSLVVSRIVAETGMFFVPGGGAPLFWSASGPSKVLWINNSWPSARAAETLMPYVFNAMWLRHTATGQSPSDATQRPGYGSLVGVMCVAMLVSLVVGAAVWLMIYYSEGLVRTNEWIGVGWSINICKGMMNLLHDIEGRDVRSSPLHIGIGAAVMLLMGICRYRIPRWPFVPIALCLGISNHVGYMWLSILIGWTCKAIVMRTGGVTVYQRLRPLFLGMIFGEVLMAGVWMAAGAIAKANGLELSNYQILPGN